MDPSTAEPVERVGSKGAPDRSSDRFEVDTHELQQFDVLRSRFARDNGQPGLDILGTR
jgi:hypothetical protein